MPLVVAAALAGLAIPIVEGPRAALLIAADMLLYALLPCLRGKPSETVGALDQVRDLISYQDGEEFCDARPRGCVAPTSPLGFHDACEPSRMSKTGVKLWIVPKRPLPSLR